MKTYKETTQNFEMTLCWVKRCKIGKTCLHFIQFWGTHTHHGKIVSDFRVYPQGEWARQKRHEQNICRSDIFVCTYVREYVYLNKHIDWFFRTISSTDNPIVSFLASK